MTGEINKINEVVEEIDKKEFNRRLKEEAEREANGRVSFTYEDIYPEQLTPHPVNIALYGDDEPDEALIESISKKGLFEPLIVTYDGLINVYRIISGHRRWRALLEINKREHIVTTINYKTGSEEGLYGFVRRKAKCQVVSFRNEDEEKQAIIEYNRRRTKRYSQLYNEIEMLHDMYDSGYIESTHFDSGCDVSTLTRELKYGEGEISDHWDHSLTDEENIKNLKHLQNTDYEPSMKKLNCMNDRVRDRIAKDLGVGRTNVGKLENVGREAKKNDPYAIKAMKFLDDGKLKINGAHIIVWLRQRGDDYANSLVEQIVTDIESKKKRNKFTPAKAFRQYKLFLPKHPAGIIVEYEYKRKRTYNVLFYDYTFDCDPFQSAKDGELDVIPLDLKTIEIPAADNCVLFFSVNIATIRYCLQLLGKWNFTVQSYTIFESKETESGYGLWFKPKYNILLLCTKGDMPYPEPENKIPGEIIRDKSGIYELIEKMYPDLKHRLEIGVDLDQQSPGWGIAIEQKRPKPSTQYKPLTDEEKAEIDRKDKENTKKTIEENNKKIEEANNTLPASPAAVSRWI